MLSAREALGAARAVGAGPMGRAAEDVVRTAPEVVHSIRNPEAAARSMATSQHEAWRLPRRLESGTFEPAWRHTTDPDWLRSHADLVQVRSEGAFVDIANLGFDHLPADWAHENLAQAGDAVHAVLRYAASGELDVATLDAASREIHAGWVARNSGRQHPDRSLHIDYDALDITARTKNWSIARMAGIHLGMAEHPSLQATLIERVRQAHGVDQLDTAARYIDRAKPAHPWVGPFLPDRVRLHDTFIAAQLAQAKPPAVGTTPTELMLFGLPGSGKTTLLKHLESSGEVTPEFTAGAVHVDPDLAKSAFPEYADLRRVGDPDAGSVVHRESAWLSDRLQQRAEAEGLNIVTQRTGRHSTDLGELIDLSISGRHRTALYVTEVSPEEAIRRAAARAAATGRHIDPAYIESTAGGIARNTLSALRSAGGVDEVRVVDMASGGAPRTALRRIEGAALEVTDRSALDAISRRAGVTDVDAWLATTQHGIRDWRASGTRVLVDGERQLGLRFASMQAFRKVETPVLAEVATKRTPVRVRWQDAPIWARPGDYIVTRGESRWPVARDLFESTYTPAEGGRWIKTAAVDARRMPVDFSVLTLEGITHGKAGDHLLQGAAGEAWHVQRDSFAEQFRSIGDRRPS